MGSHVVLLGAPPEVDAPRVAGDVEHGQTLETGEGHGHPVTLERERARDYVNK